MDFRFDLIAIFLILDVASVQSTGKKFTIQVLLIARNSYPYFALLNIVIAL